MLRVPSGCRDFVVVKAGKLFLDGAIFGFCWLLGGSDMDALGLLVPSLVFPPPSPSLSKAFFGFSESSLSFLDVLISSSTVRVEGFRSAAAWTAAGLGSAVVSALFSCTVSSIDFPLGPREGIFAGACNDDDCCSALADSCPFCFDVVDGGGVPLLVGVADCTLILGGADGAGVDAGVLFEPASSAFFPAIEAIIGCCLDEAREEGGGLFNRGEAGHCGVESPEAGPALLGPPRGGSFDTASVTAPPALSCGTLLADNARCMAAAEGCVEKDWPANGPGRLSLRIGDVFREDLGLALAEGEEE